ncbi:MAG: PEP-CTERM sorting domain-containing protein [Gemmatimonadaceae bacterium]
MYRPSRIALMLLALAGAAASPASAQLIGTGTGTNIFPFGGANSGPASTIYQQIYASSDFGGPELISAIEFFRAGVGDLRSGTYDLYLSTTTVAVIGLNTTDYDSNRGADNTLFGSYVLSGAAPATLVFAGTPFAYDPSDGNLLLDVRVSDASPTVSGAAPFLANRGDAGGVYSRATDFIPVGATSFVDWGLVTQFDATPITAAPEPASLWLMSTGVVGVAAIRRRRRR